MRASLTALIIVLLFSTCRSAREVTDNLVYLLPKSEVELNLSPLEDSVTTEIRIGTFLGNEKRNYYGNLAPDSLRMLWKFYLGEGKTRVGRSIRTWAGAGWTGQPLLVEENGVPYLIQGAYDHSLRKINAITGVEVWRYMFDDVIKGTGTLWQDRKQRKFNVSFLVFQGSRMGYDNNLSSKIVPSYRAISYWNGRESWRLNSKRTRSYSRDVDGSALMLNDTLYIGLENGLFTVIDPDVDHADSLDGIIQPKKIQQSYLYNADDVKVHGGNVVTESSPSLLGNHIYIASGSGHVYGYNLDSRSIDWDFKTGSDIDGTAVVTSDNKLIVSIEKQYIEGKGGAIKLDPQKPPKDAVEWYFPVEDRDFVSWEGGVVGTVGTNDATRKEGWPKLAAIAALDGNVYVVETDKFAADSLGNPVYSKGFTNTARYRVPRLVYKKTIGASISTPIFVGDKLIVASYSAIHLFKYNAQGEFRLIDKYTSSFESTPIAVDGRIYIASRDGYLYCFGNE